LVSRKRVDSHQRRKHGRGLIVQFHGKAHRKSRRGFFRRAKGKREERGFYWFKPLEGKKEGGERKKTSMTTGGTELRICTEQKTTTEKSRRDL